MGPSAGAPRPQNLGRTASRTGKSPLPCTALSSSCFVDAYWNLYACSIWDAKVGNLRENAFDLRGLWESDRRRELRTDVMEERCSHCWTPCEAYPTILGNLARAAVTRATDLPILLHGTRLHLGVVVALVAAILAWVFLWRTTTGYRLRAAGASRHDSLSRSAIFVLARSRLGFCVG
jgi:radical SAM protein with 4Fe4S-binding SPASM domain